MIFPDFPSALHHFDSIDSTNLEARRMLDEGFVGTCVISAGTQTGGRGRLERVWSSPLGNIYMTICIPQTLIQDANSLPFMAAIAVRNAIAPNDHIFFKWPNDVLLFSDGSAKKCCGILAESYKGHFIIGIGINTKIFPENAMYPASALIEINATTSIENIYSAFQDVVALADVRSTWMKHAYFVDQNIKIGNESGEFLGIDANMNAMLKTQGGIKICTYGDVSSASPSQ